MAVLEELECTEQDTSQPPAVESDSPPCSSTPRSSGSHDSSLQHNEIQIHPAKPPPQPLNPPPADGFEDGGGGGKRKLSPDFSFLKRENVTKKGLLGFRVFGFLFCLVSFSVMAADRDKGWAFDSFYRYKEFRYCMALNVISFLYSGVQGFDLVYQLATGKFRPLNSRRYQIDFLIDQTLTYLLLSASSSAAVRVDDWQSNWGKDKFPQMATASVSLSFLAFVAFALSSLVSGCILFTMKYR